MVTGALSLLERSLRVDARSWQTHVTRLGLMLAIYVSLTFAYIVAGSFGAPGLRFFSANILLNVIFMTLLGVSFFSTPITEEKEEDTLGLMLMAGISPLGLLIGKLGGRLVQALLLIAIQYPFTLLAITMGGVSPSQIQAAYIGLGSYMLMLAGGGLLCSTLAPRSRTAGTWMVVALIVYGGVPFLCRTISFILARSPSTSPSNVLAVLNFIASLSLFQRIETIMSTGFGESTWSWQAASNLTLGVVCFGLSWCCFGFAAKEPSTEATTRRGLAISRKGMARSFAPGRVWEKNPFAWKDFHFAAGGLSHRLWRMMAYAALYVACLGWSVLLSGGSFDHVKNAVAVYQGWLLVILIWELSLLAATSIQEEVRGQTVASLVLLPHSPRYVFYSKLLGVVAGMYPGFVCLAVACFAFPYNVKDFFRFEGHVLIGLLMLIPHFSAVFALFVRWGAVPLGFGAMIATYFLIVVMLQFVMPRGGPASIESMLNAIAFVLFLICVACHVFIIRQIPRLASR